MPSASGTVFDHGGLDVVPGHDHGFQHYGGHVCLTVARMSRLRAAFRPWPVEPLPLLLLLLRL